MKEQYTESKKGKIRSWWKARSITTRVILVGIIGLCIILFLTRDQGVEGAVVETVKKETLTRTVIASGTVVSSTDLSLGFEVSDVVRSVNVKVGDTVKVGAVLATLSNAEESAAYNSARGALLAAQARYDKVLEGSSTEEVRLAEVQLNNTKTSNASLVENARRKLYSDDLVADAKELTNQTPPVISGTYTGSEEGEYRIVITDDAVTSARTTGLEKVDVEVDEIPKPLGTRGLRIAFPDDSYARGSRWTVTIPNKSGIQYTQNLNSYNAALSTQSTAIAEAQARLDVTLATARKPDVDAALAEVVTARAQLQSAQAQLSKKVLRAPADGTVTTVDVKVGEITTPQAPVLVVQNVSNLYLEANIGEGNISTIALDQIVNVTYDAFPGKTYTATVSSIDPAATLSGTTINYKIKALIDTSDNESEIIRPGMTANMSIVTATLPDVLVLPGRVIETDKQGTFVNTIIDENDKKQKTKRTDIVSGITGDGDRVEIKSGLEEGQSVLWIPEEQ